MRKRRQRGMTLLELLVVVGIVGILAAVSIWNYFVAINKAKQKRTLADMRSVAMAWEIYAHDTETFVPSGAIFEFPDETTVTADQLEAVLSPQYIKSFPKTDGWGNDFDFGLLMDSGDTNSVNLYAIRSRGADGLVDESYDAQFTKSFDNDIIYSNGSFVISPEKK